MVTDRDVVPQQYFWWLSVQWCTQTAVYDYCRQRSPPSHTRYFHNFDDHKWERLYWYMTIHTVTTVAGA